MFLAFVIILGKYTPLRTQDLQTSLPYLIVINHFVSKINELPIMVCALKTVICVTHCDTLLENYERAKHGGNHEL